MTRDAPRDIGRGAALLLCCGVYVLAVISAAGTVSIIGSSNPLLTALAAAVVATTVVFGFSFGFDNSSLYDPYWSVAPLPIALYWMLNPESLQTHVPRQLIVAALVACWGARLTYNWTRSWRGMRHEDWRYVDFRQRPENSYWLISFFGIHLAPTAFVFAGCLPLYAVFAAGRSSLGALDAVALVVCGGSIWLEATADRQLMRWRREPHTSQEVLNSGLWARSRHPNYLGEIGFWWGLYLFGLAAAPHLWWTLLGPVAITLLFLTISLPMIERRMQERRPDFVKQMSAAPRLVPLLHIPPFLQRRRANRPPTQTP